MTQFEQLDLLLNEYGGIIQTFQVIDNGISKPVFYSYVKERGLDQAAHGVYVSPDTWTDAMYILHLRCSQAVFSHETALFFHDLTNREAARLDLHGMIQTEKKRSTLELRSRSRLTER